MPGIPGVGGATATDGGFLPKSPTTTPGAATANTPASGAAPSAGSSGSTQTSAGSVPSSGATQMNGGGGVGALASQFANMGMATDGGMPTTPPTTGITSQTPTTPPTGSSPNGLGMANGMFGQGEELLGSVGNTLGINTGLPTLPSANAAPASSAASGTSIPPVSGSGSSSGPTAEQLSSGSLQGVGTGAGQNLIGTQINPAQAPDLAAANSQAYQAWVNENDPVYEQALRQATEQAAATGSLGSGQLETNLGSLADTFANQAMAQETQGNETALQQDFANQNTNIGQLNEQQNNQENLEQQGVNNAAAQQAAQQAAQAQQFNEGLEETEAGQGTSPQNIKQSEAATSQNQANSTAAGAGNTLGNQSMLNQLKSGALNILGGGNSGGSSVGSGTSPSTVNSTGGLTPVSGQSGVYTDGSGNLVDANGNPIIGNYAGQDTSGMTYAPDETS